MRVTATIDTRVAVRGDELSQARELEFEAEAYEVGRDELLAQVPEGWMALGIMAPYRSATYRR